ncbi:MAG TPA: SMP-30/gluconolactonase/LRE family protein, partial [Pseudonocardiaceae bacterium]|nr:SMP-30/gluconolactonase/LRE family protein [Pseudonocardiaceae bacterium]
MSESPRRLRLPGRGPEDVAVLDDDHLVTGVADGRLLRVTPATGAVDEVADTGGRPLGIEPLPDGRLAVCDARRGLLRVDPRTGAVDELVTGLGLCDNAAVTGDGAVYFTDSSLCHPLDRYPADIVERTRTGRLLRRDPSGYVDVVLDGLEFANGVTLAADESFVAVAQTGAARIDRVWLTGPRAGCRDTFAADLPGLPDNLSTGSDGTIWVALPTPVPPGLHLVHRCPRPVRRTLGRAAAALCPTPDAARVQGFSPAGTLVHDVRLRGSGYRMATGVRAHAGALWLGSLVENAIGVLDDPENRRE